MHLRVRNKSARAGRENGAPTAERMADHPVAQNAQLLQFLHWLVPLVLGFALLEGIAFLAFRDVGTGLTATVLLGHGCLMLVARAQVKRGKLRAAVILICVTFLGAILVMVPIQPTLIPTLAVSPFMPVAVALPYAGKRILGLLIIVAWAVVIAVAILGELLSSYSTLPPWYNSFFRVASLSTASAVILLLLWQFRSRLFNTLAQVREAREQAIYDATHDALTGLPNRALLLERLDRSIERAREDEGYIFAVLFLDLDRFKNVNDSLGHEAGDKLLIEIARRLETCRVNPTDTVARLGGDEFVLLLEDMADPANAARAAERVQEELGAPFGLDGHELYTTASIGVVVGDPGYDRPEHLLRDADTAMHRAKEEGKARYEIFNTAMRARAVSLLRLETDLRRAVELREFVVHYQPIVSLRSGRIVGFETLVRWQHPKRGLIPPEEFISLAEETGLIGPIDMFVLRRACLRMGLWQREYPDHRPLSINVNLSATQLARPGLAEQIGVILHETGLGGRNLRLEITESALMQDAKLATEALSDLRDRGVRIHIDDFGIGYSSLSLLHQLPVDALKIDRSFVDGMEADSESVDVVQAIITLAHSLGLDVVAEGVETREQLESLREMGCEYGQGSHFSKPVDARTAEVIIAAEPRW